MGGKVPAHKLVEFIGKTMFKPVNKSLGTETMVWQPLRDGDVVPMDGAHSNLVGAPPLLAGCLENEVKLFEAFLPRPRSKAHAVAAMVDVLRGYFHVTNKDDKAGDASEWTRHAASLYELLESCRSKRGLPTGIRDVYGAAFNLVTFEDPCFCLQSALLGRWPWKRHSVALRIRRCRGRRSTWPRGQTSISRGPRSRHPVPECVDFLCALWQAERRWSRLDSVPTHHAFERNTGGKAIQGRDPGLPRSQT